MFSFPKQAEFNRVLPKSKIYAHAKPGKAVKNLFVSQIGEIVWKYKLSPETVNLPARHGITEIQVFEIALKTEELDQDVLRTIDKAIPFPILFQLTHGDRIRFATSYKRPSDADSTKWVIEASFQTDWFHPSSFILYPSLSTSLPSTSTSSADILPFLSAPVRASATTSPASRPFRPKKRSASKWKPA